MAHLRMLAFVVLTLGTAATGFAQALVPFETFAPAANDNRLFVLGSQVSLKVDSVDDMAADGRFVAVNQSSLLFWEIDAKNRKITVQTNLASPRYRLRLAAVSATDGTPTGERLLSTTPQNFLLNVGKTEGLCLLRYTGEAYPEDGAGTDQHTVTFTIIQQ